MFGRFSRAARHARQACDNVQKSLHHQRDLLKPEHVTAIQDGINALRAAARTGDATLIRQRMGELETVWGKWMRPYPNSGARETVEMFLVAIAVAVGIRTFVLQPFSIPTGSMQPTLFGITQENLNGKNVEIPGFFGRWLDWAINGVTYYHEVADASGPITWEPPKRVLVFNLYQRYRIGNGPVKWIFFPPEELFERRAGLQQGTPVQAGEAFINARVVTGDHLFVDRLTYNFRPPRRGEIIVFETAGIEGARFCAAPGWSPPPDQFYIKRLVALGGEKVRIGDDRHVVINGRRLDNREPHFEKVYQEPARPYVVDSEYSGHQRPKYPASQGTGIPGGPQYPVVPVFPDANTEFQVRPDHFLPMGDNTASSSDGRLWGDVPKRNIMGRSFMVYWPFGGTTVNGKTRPARFGWGHD